MDKIVNEDEYISQIMDFLAEYGADPKGYSRKIVEDEILYIIENPGWSISRSRDILFNLQDFVNENFKENPLFEECFNGVNIFLK